MAQVAEVTAYLKPHTGMQDTEAGQVPYTHPDQWMVYYAAPEMEGERFVGYLPKRSGAPFLPAGTHWMTLPAGMRQLIHDAVSRAVEEKRPMGIVPLPISALENFEEAQPEDEEEEDEEEDVQE